MISGLVRYQIHHITLEIANQILVEGSRYRSTGVDPQFLLRSSRLKLPGEWVLISYWVEAATSVLEPVLYVDDGNGFSQQHAIRLPRGLGKIETLVRLPDRVVALRLDPLSQPGVFCLRDVTIRHISKVELGLRLLWDEVIPLFGSLNQLQLLSRKILAVWTQEGLRGLRNRLARRVLSQKNPVLGEYKAWIGLYDTLSDADRKMIRERIAQFNRKPLISVLMPVYNTPEKWLRLAINSVFNQLYPYWELCIADDASTAPHIRPLLKEYQAKDKRIKVVFRDGNGHIAATSNSALELAGGEWIALLDHDDELAEHALYMVAEEFNSYPSADLIYSDEDKIGEDGQRYEPWFKTDWNPDLMTSNNQIVHLGVFRTALVKAIGGFRLGYEGSQDYDLALRVIEKTTADQIRHIPHILYHWRAISGSVANRESAKDYAYEAARKAVQHHLDRRSIHARVTPGYSFFSHRVIYSLPDRLPMVSVIIPTKDRLDLLRVAVQGVLDKTDYPNLELIVVDNQSEHQETLAYLKALEGSPTVRVIRYDAPYNYSAINNMAVRRAKGEIIALVNNDIEVISRNWLKEMVSHALRPEIGAVGAKLFYPNDTIQHAGILLGLGGLAGHAHKDLPRHTPGYFGRACLIQNFSAVTAACMVLRRQVFDEVGGFDEENFAIAFNDVDLCLRLRKRKYRIMWTPYAELYHHESASLGLPETPERRDRFIKEATYLKTHWGNVLAHDPYYNPNLTLDGGDFSLAFPTRALKPWEHPCFGE